MLVVDASVIVRSVLPGVDSTLAQRIVRRGDLHAPWQAWLETANAFRRRIGPAAIDDEEARSFLAGLPGLVRLHDDRALAERAFGLAVELDHDVYDCLYLSLALELGCPVVTADRGFAAKASRRHRGAAIALADWR